MYFGARTFSSLVSIMSSPDEVGGRGGRCKAKKEKIILNQMYSFPFALPHSSLLPDENNISAKVLKECS